MSHAGGTRARFFPSQSLPSDVSGAVNSSHRTDATSSPTKTSSMDPAISESSDGEPISHNTSLFAFSQTSSHLESSHLPQPASYNAEGEIVSQRTRMTEIETLYKAKTKQERSARLNISGFLKHSNSSMKSIEAAPQNATIQEITEHEELNARSPRHHSGQKIISSSNLSSPNISSYSLPINQSSSFKVPHSRQSLRAESPGVDNFTNGSSSVIHHRSNDSHTATQAFNIDSLQDHKKAFSRRRSTVVRPTSAKIANPSQNTANTEASLRMSPRLSTAEATGKSARNPDMAVSHRRSEERQVVELEEDEIDEGSLHAIGEPDISEKGPLLRHDPRERGEKRLVGLDDHTNEPAGKRARTDMYDDPLAADDRLSLSPRADSVAYQHDAPSRLRSFTEASQDRSSGQDPQLKFFLGQDVDEYLSTHMERYDAAVKRWSECSRDEWEKGADELVEKFTQILDHVKEHVKRKVAIFASLHARVDEHQKAREGTAEMLREARRQLVAKTGVVVDDDSAGFTL